MTTAIIELSNDGQIVARIPFSSRSRLQRRRPTGVTKGTACSC